MPRRICVCGKVTDGAYRCADCEARHRASLSRGRGIRRARAEAVRGTDPRRTAEWQRLRRRLVAEAEVCAICGVALDHNAPARSRLSPTIDHIVPWSLGGDPWDEGNLRVVHYGCNSARGAREQDSR